MCEHRIPSVVLANFVQDKDLAKIMADWSSHVHFVGGLVEPGYAASQHVTREEREPIIRQWGTNGSFPSSFVNSWTGITVFSRKEDATPERIHSAAGQQRGIVFLMKLEECSEEQVAAIRQVSQKVACVMTDSPMGALQAAFSVVNFWRGPGIYNS